MAYSTIDRPSNNFRIKLYTGNGSTQSITFDESTAMQPDCTWIKVRNDTNVLLVHDVIRGATKEIYTDLSNAEATDVNGLTAFNSNGFSVGSANGVNRNGYNCINWSWKANGTGVSNTAGSITSTVSANTTSGFSIVKYTGNATNGATVGHGLGAVPDMLIGKDLSDGSGWGIWHKNLSGATYRLSFDTDAQSNDSALFGGSGAVLPTSTVFTLGSGGGLNGANANIVYCFTSIKGYSKFGSYTGNGSADGTFVYTGFKPSFVLFKRTDSAGYDWCIYDNKRDPYNVAQKELYTNGLYAEGTATNNMDFLSNGFKPRRTSAGVNASGGTYIYMAFAENPFVSSKSIPTTARWSGLY